LPLAVQRFLRRLASGLVVSLLGVVGCTSAGDDPGPPVPVQPAGIYAQMCVRCHGPEGHGDPEIKKTMANVRDFSDPEFQGRATRISRA
jgi:hypothetical protein